MKSNRVISFAACALLLAGCAANESGSAQSGSLSGELVGAGASSQGAAQEAWIAGFQTAHPDVVVNYDPAGSGTGRETFQNGASAFAGSDRAFTVEEIAGGNFGSCADGSNLVEFPSYISPIAVLFNLPGVNSLNAEQGTSMPTMKAARWYGQRDIRVEDIPVPAITRPNQVKIAVKYTGICGSDLHEYLGGPIFIPVAQEHPYSQQKAPLTMGHEFPAKSSKQAPTSPTSNPATASASNPSSRKTA